MVQQISGTVAFFKAMAPVLIANVLTVTFVYCFAKVSQKERRGEEEGLLTYLWLIILVFLFMHVWASHVGCFRRQLMLDRRLVGSCTSSPCAMHPCFEPYAGHAFQCPLAAVERKFEPDPTWSGNDPKPTSFASQSNDHQQAKPREDAPGIAAGKIGYRNVGAVYMLGVSIAVQHMR